MSDETPTSTDTPTAPALIGGDGYSELWEITCPGGCGHTLEWQRILYGRGPEGRWVDEDNVLTECPECGHDLEPVVPHIP